MTTYQMLWDCKYCGTQKLLGLTHRHCPTCGAPQDATARYFPSDADKVEVQNHAYVGADVVCPACQEANSKRSQHCFNCGSPLAEGAAVRRRDDREIPDGAIAPIDSKAAATLEAQTALQANAGQANTGKRRAEKRERKHTWRSDLRTLAYIFVPIIVLFFGFVIVNVVFTKSVQVQATKHHWEREIAVEKYGDVREGDWCDETPSGARIIDRQMKTRSHKKVPDGESCTTRQSDNGDGTFSEHEVCKTTYKSVPVESLYCTYLVTKWHFERTAKAEGNEPSPAWPATHITRPGQCVGCEREGTRKETYELVLRDLASGEENSCEFSEDKWRSFAPGTKFDAELMMVGGLVCDTLVAK